MNSTSSAQSPLRQGQSTPIHYLHTPLSYPISDSTVGLLLYSDHRQNYYAILGTIVHEDTNQPNIRKGKVGEGFRWASSDGIV